MSTQKSAVTGGGNAPRVDWKSFDKIEDLKTQLRTAKRDLKYWTRETLEATHKLEQVTAQRDELLAALKDCKEYLKCFNGIHSGTEGSLYAVTKAEAAIAKAEGSEKPDESDSEQDRDDLIDDGRSDGYGESYAERNA